MAEAKQFSAVIVPHSSDLPPISIFSVDEAAFFEEVGKKMAEVRKGWCLPMVNGAKCDISAPKVVFDVKLPDGTVRTFGGSPAAAFVADGSFSVPQ
ncbi:MAG: hypothetical protein E4H01_08880 [Lysobacterales bacterium]|nr:MAG: hypothetical protein E4H01_08880 [Xanthomonadales bacterium]